MIPHNSGSIDSSVLSQIKDSLEELMIQLEASKKFYTLKDPPEGFSYHWFFDATTKMLERFNPSIEIEIIEEHDEDNYLCAYREKTIIVQKDKIGNEVQH